MIEFANGLGLVVGSHEVLDVSSRFLNVPRELSGSIGPWPTTTERGLSAIDLVDGREPVEQSLPIRFDGVEMRARIDGFAGDHETYQGHVEAGG
jgi:hypothetical protein